ncbi:MAG: T9SS type A sorting domain-containing protein [Candidatus Hydrothermales bacterium]
MKWGFILIFLFNLLLGQVIQDTIFRAKLRGIEVQDFLPASLLRIDSFKTLQIGEWVTLRCYATLSDLTQTSGDILRFKIHGLASSNARRTSGNTFTGFLVSGPNPQGYYTSKVVLRDRFGNFKDTIPLIRSKLSGISFKNFDNTQKALSGFITSGPDASGYVYLIAVFNALLGYYESKPPSDKFKGEVRPSGRFFFYGVYPNPVKGFARIKFGVGKETNVEIEVLDVSGRVIKRLLSKVLKPGVYSIEWDLLDEKGTKVGSGVYFIRYRAGEKIFMRKFSVVE